MLALFRSQIFILINEAEVIVYQNTLCFAFLIKNEKGLPKTWLLDI